MLPPAASEFGREARYRQLRCKGEVRDDLRQLLSPVSPVTIDAFMEKNKEQHSLTAAFSLKVGYTELTEAISNRVLRLPRAVGFQLYIISPA